MIKFGVLKSKIEKTLLESDSLFEEDSYINLSKAKNSLGQMESQLEKLLRD